METSDICRVCMEDDGHTFCSLFNATTECPVPPSSLIAQCAGVAVNKGDGLPEMICSDCLSALKEAFKIREKCRKTDRKLRKILNLAHKNQTDLDTVNSDETANLVLGEGPISDKTTLETNDAHPVSALDSIKSELKSVSPPIHEAFIDPSDQETVNINSDTSSSDHSTTNRNENNPEPAFQNTELSNSTITLVKQEYKQITNDKEGNPLHEIEKTIQKMYNDHTQEVDEYKNTDFATKLECYMNNKDEGESVNMEVEILEDDLDDYEDYEAIDEDFESHELDVASVSNEVSVCCGCFVEFRTQTELDNHSKSIHLPDKDKDSALHDNYMCDVCYKRHSSMKALKYHKSNILNQKFRTCNICHLVLNSIRKKRHHEQLHKLLPEDFEINCCGCNEVVLFNQLGAHAEQFHNKTIRPTISKFMCELCCLDCGFKQRLDNHQLKQNIPQVIVHKQHQLDDKFIAPVADIDGKQRFICDICGNHFSTKGNLKSHRTLHEALDKPFKCSICKKEFSKKSNYNVHMLRAHSAESLFPCSECNKSFKCATNLKTHMRVHTKEKPYRCEFCQKSFGYLSDKRRHEIGHSGNYPYKCNICGKPYTRKTLLDRHLKSCRKYNTTRLKAENKAEMPNRSKQVTTEFKHNQMLTCDLCDDWFPTMEELADHHAEIHIQTLDEGTYDAEVEIE